MNTVKAFGFVVALLLMLSVASAHNEHIEDCQTFHQSLFLLESQVENAQEHVYNLFNKRKSAEDRRYTLSRGTSDYVALTEVINTLNQQYQWAINRKTELASLHIFWTGKYEETCPP